MADGNRRQPNHTRILLSTITGEVQHYLIYMYQQEICFFLLLLMMRKKFPVHILISPILRRVLFCKSFIFLSFFCILLYTVTNSIHSTDISTTPWVHHFTALQRQFISFGMPSFPTRYIALRLKHPFLCP